MTSQSGGTVSGYPGVASDGASGLIVDGSETISGGVPDEAPGDGTPYTSIAGYTTLGDAPENATNDWQVLFIKQHQPLVGNITSGALVIERGGALNGHDYTGAVITVNDHSGATGGALKVLHGATPVFEVNHAGGVGQYGTAAPAAQPTPTIATSTITDAVAKAAIKALILIINNSGAALITET